MSLQKYCEDVASKVTDQNVSEAIKKNRAGISDFLGLIEIIGTIVTLVMSNCGKETAVKSIAKPSLRQRVAFRTQVQRACERHSIAMVRRQSNRIADKMIEASQEMEEDELLEAMTESQSPDNWV